jgi:hypothetical protein
MRVGSTPGISSRISTISSYVTSDRCSGKGK